jgi:hypothetical protein
MHKTTFDRMQTSPLNQITYLYDPLHVIARVMAHFNNGNIKLRKNGVDIKINNLFLNDLGLNEFKYLTVWQSGKSIGKPKHYNTLFAQNTLIRMEFRKTEFLRNRNYDEAEYDATYEFVNMFEKIFQFFVRSGPFEELQHDEAEIYQEYVNNIHIDIPDPSITENALKTTLFAGLMKLTRNNINFDLYYLNQWRIETIFDTIKYSSEEDNKPTKKEFVCSLNRILKREYIDSNKHELSILSKYIDVAEIDYKEFPPIDIYNILKHPTIKLNFDAPILYIHVFITMSKYEENIITPKFFTTNMQDINALEHEMRDFKMPMNEVHKF